MKTRRLRGAMFIAGAAAGWLLIDRWQRSFHKIKLHDVELTDRTGTPRVGKRVCVQSILGVPSEAVWAKVTTPALLAYIAHPLLTFKPQNGAPLPEGWHEGDSLRLNLFGLGKIPLGPHTIHIERIDTAKREIQSRESGRMAETWWHFISVQDYPGNRTLYTDTIDIYAGPLTGAVACFARFFYCYRQTRWRSVAKSLDAPGITD